MRDVRSRLALLMILMLAVSSIQAQETPTPSATPESGVELSIWWPDELVGNADNAPHPILLEQSDAFVAGENNLTIEHRLKPVGTTGGVLSTLRTAANVAPGAMPSVTLIRRQDLIFAQRAGLIQSLEGGVPSSIQGDLNAALALGQLDGQLYGLPYMLDLTHVAYRAEDNNLSNWDYASFLERDLPLIFPGSGNGGLNDVFLLQYLSAGGTVNADGTLALNEDALLTTLTFYDNAVADNLVTEDVLDYTDVSDYLGDFTADSNAVAVLHSRDFLQLYDEDDSLRAASIPTASGQPTTLLNGWMWVIVATNPVEREAAERYIAWMMETSRQRNASIALFSLPSRRTALTEPLAGGADGSAFIGMLERPLLPVSESEGGLLGREIQEALAAVINGERSAEDAVSAVMAAVN